MCAVTYINVILALVLLMVGTIFTCTQHELRVKGSCNMSDTLRNKDGTAAYRVKMNLTDLGTKCLDGRSYVISRSWTPKIVATPNTRGRHWKLGISWEMIPGMRQGKYLLKVVAKFSPRYSEDACTTRCIAVEIEELSPRWDETYYLQVRCLQVLFGRTATVKLDFGNTNPPLTDTYQFRDDISTECTCDKQRTVISNDTCSVSFRRERWVTDYAIQMEDGSTVKYETRIKRINQTMTREDLPVLCSNDSVKINIAYRCTDVTTRVCKKETLPLQCQSPQCSPVVIPSVVRAPCDTFPCRPGDIILVVVVSLLVLIAAIVTVIYFVCRRRAGRHQTSHPNNTEQERLVQDCKCTMLSHHATNEDVQAVGTMVSLLETRHIHAYCPSLNSVERDVLAGWQQVGEKIGKDSEHIIILMSAGISSLCDAMYSDVNDETIKQILLERHEENIPGVVMTTLRVRSTDSSLQNNTHVHLVSFDCSTTLRIALPFYRREPSVHRISTIYCVHTVCESPSGVQEKCTCQPKAEGQNIFDFERLVSNIRANQIS